MRRTGLALVIASTLSLQARGGEGIDAVARLQAEPAEIALAGPGARHGLLVTATGTDGRVFDVTRPAVLTSSDPKVVAVDPDQRLRAAGDGEATVTAAHGGKTASIKVRVSGAATALAPSFRHEVVPALTRFGCNQGMCHGKEAGQNGFKLSLRGFAPEADHERLLIESLGRRISPSAPDLSLVVAKATGALPHRGGVLFERGSAAHRLLVRWIESGSPTTKADEPALSGLEILGGGRLLRTGQDQPLLVLAKFADGAVRDVTWLCKYYSNDVPSLEVNEHGVVRARRVGASTVRAHYQDRVAVAAFTIPREGAVDPAAYLAKQNEVDAHVFAKLADLRLPISPGCADEEFLRRAFIDTIGLPPTPDEVRAFLADPAADKRATAVDALLARPEFVDTWAQLLGDLLQNRKERDHDVRGAKGVRAFHQWLREQVAANRPWNELARDVITATGSTADRPEIGYFVVTVGEQRHADRSDAVAAVAQSFLGTRIVCAKCHNHPDERYTQDDYYHFAAFFSAMTLDRKAPEKGPTDLSFMTPQEQEQRKRATELEKQIAQMEISLKEKPEPEQEKIRKDVDQRRKQREEAVKRADEARRQPVRISQPRTGKAILPQPLDRSAVPISAGEDPRKALADWIVDPKNESFSGAMVNRIWRHFMGVGMVEPVDDLRTSNPPANGPLWKHLNERFVSSGYDLRALMRHILTSRAYQLSSSTVAGNENDRRFHSHAYSKRLSAEVMLDAISQATGVPDAFQGYPVGIRATQLPDPTVESHFLRLFGRSDRVTACACERNGEVTLPQLLHLQNGDSVVQKIQAPEGRLAALLKDKKAPAEIAETLTLAVLGRTPSPSEQAAFAKALAAPKADAEEVLRDYFWALLNSKDFVFNH